MVRKKRGSSLITVVIISGILITVGAAMLSMTLGDYKMRITESTRIKNLYSSDSGLDVAYDILIKTFDAGAIYGVKEVESYKKTQDFIIEVAKDLKKQVKDLEEEKESIRLSNDTDKSKKIRDCNEKIDELDKKIKIEEDKAIDAYFKKEFNDFVYMNEIPADVTKINSLANKDELRKCTKAKKYIKDIEKSKDSERYEEVNFNTENTIDLFVDEETEGDNKGITFNSISEDAQKGKEYPTRNYEIKITSKYVTEDTNGKTERKLQSIYNMIVPDYKDVAFNESNVELPKYTFLNDKAIIVGKNMNINDASLSVFGNIFVEGDDGELANDRVYDKYKGGIILDANSNRKIEFTGDVITGKTFNVRNNIDATISGSLYAMNVYAGSEKQTDTLSKNSTLDIKTKDNDGGEVVVDNDITLKADYTKITMDKFYGINDKNIKYDDTKEINKSGEPLGRTSSSIIVNAHANSGIKINTEAYIMGVAHINTTNGYSTGESTGIKGNYIAYAAPSVDKDGNIDGNEEFEYNEPLQLLKEDNVIEKSEHFLNYWKDKLGTIDYGGIELPEKNTHSIGAIVYKGSDTQLKVIGSSYSLDKIPAVVRDKQKEFASKVYNVSGKTLTPIKKQEIYETLGSEKDKVEDLMDIGSTLDDYKEINKIFFKGYGNIEQIPNEEDNNEKAIFSDKNIKIRESSKDNIAKDGDGIVINVPKNNTLNAFIVTSGNVTIEGNVNIEGNIIAGGNLEVSGFEKKTIKYNKELSDRIQSSNVELFNSVFGHMRNDDQEESQEPEKDTQANLKVQYDVNKFIKNMRWKIIK